MINNICKNVMQLHRPLLYSFSSGATFLKMVESFFDRASVHTFIRTDRLNFYKKAENVVKCNIPLIRGTPSPTQTTDPSKPSPPIDANIKPINSPPKEEPGMPKMSTLKRSKHSPVS